MRVTRSKSERSALCALCLAGTLSGCSSSDASSSNAHASGPAPAPAAERSHELPTQGFGPTATIQELMLGQIDPAADFLWDSVASISRLSGIEERQPRTDEEWQAVRFQALTLIEATNLLVIEGRKVSRDFLPASADGDIDSNEMAGKIAAQPALFVAFARGLHDAGLQTLQTIDARDPAALFDTGSVLDAACENCHMTFWYPKLQLR